MRNPRPRIQMTLCWWLAIALATWSTVASAATIYGTITESGGQPAVRQRITVECPGREEFHVRTDSSGSYRAVTNHNGRCTLRLEVPNLPTADLPTADVVFRADATRYDFQLTNGQLRRR